VHQLKMSVESQTHMFFQLVRPSMKKILTLGFLHAPQSSIWHVASTDSSSQTTLTTFTQQ
jgi:hypothetical protein